MSSLWGKLENLITYLKKPSSTSKKLLSSDRFLHAGKTSPHFLRSLKGSMTVEASLIIPFFLIAAINLTSLMECMRLYGNYESAICDAGADVALAYGLNEYGGTEDGESFLPAGVYLSGAYLTLAIKNTLNEKTDYGVAQKGMSMGAVMVRALEENGEMGFVVLYRAGPVFDPGSLMSFWTGNAYYGHVFTGYEPGGDLQGDTTTVYVTKYGTVYHRSLDCPSLSIKSRSVSSSQIDSERNSAGGKYSECALCKNKPFTGTYYITQDGDRYHRSSDCRGLKRTVSSMLLYEAEAMYRPCSRCGH
ncbi:MAG: hypothetical protein K6F84_00895 [Lachnospiraceae bacterium]|nr:hypothetical protein [Lachnospiraceae bacterium]